VEYGEEVAVVAEPVVAESEVVDGDPAEGTTGGNA
jgi:hypothetical protein